MMRNFRTTLDTKRGRSLAPSTPVPLVEPEVEEDVKETKPERVKPSFSVNPKPARRPNK